MARSDGDPKESLEQRASVQLTGQLRVFPTSVKCVCVCMCVFNKSPISLVYTMFAPSFSLTHSVLWIKLTVWIGLLHFCSAIVERGFFVLFFLEGEVGVGSFHALLFNVPVVDLTAQAATQQRKNRCLRYQTHWPSFSLTQSRWQENCLRWKCVMMKSHKQAKHQEKISPFFFFFFFNNEQ